VAEIMTNFSNGLTNETLTAMLEENVKHYEQDDANKDTEHLEKCVQQARDQLDESWKQWLVDSLKYLAELGGTIDSQQKTFLKIIPQELGLKIESEKTAD
jgi:regulator of sirC expression with transglutaminase-like and TPR domain